MSLLPCSIKLTSHQPFHLFCLLLDLLGLFLPDGRTDGWTDGWLAGWMDEWMKWIN